LSIDFHLQGARPREGRDARQIFSLNGAWEIEPGGRATPPPAWQRTIHVPSLVDTAEPAYDHRVSDYHWYRRVFTVPPTMRREIALLVIEQAMYGTAVWVNGRFAGEDIACYTSQEYDITQFLEFGVPNVLLVRVGARATLPPESAAGRDQERESFIPGIWGDVALVMTGTPRCTGVQMIPQIASSEAEIRVMIAPSAVQNTVSVGTCIFEKVSGRLVTGDIELPVVLQADGETPIIFRHAIRDMQLWSPESPFLYEAETIVRVDGRVVDRLTTTFGMREFTIRDGHFHLNGKRVFLRGGNIGFHRFLSDPERARLPWDLSWVKRILIDIPREHHFNFFRIHLGQAYNRWYDLADAHGMLIQNEWQFWMATGSEEQITKEFTRWLRDNWNHPSIVIWDALNESSDVTVEQRVIPKMKRLDPTRPWEPNDFVDDHPYIYTLGPVLIDRKFGYTRSLQDIAASPTPAVVNEFLWWWLDRNGAPTVLTRDVVARWVGEGATHEEIEQHQCFLAAELVELFRRMRVDAVQPFVYLSNNQGPTANWFLGPIRELQPRPLLRTLRNAFSPVGISLELWDRHFFPGEHRTIPLHVMNDVPEVFTGAVTCGVQGSDGAWIMQRQLPVSVDPSGRWVKDVEVVFPEAEGTYHVVAELHGNTVQGEPVRSRKVAYVIAALPAPAVLHRVRIGVMDPRGEVTAYLRRRDVTLIGPEHFEEPQPGILVVAEHASREAGYRQMLPMITRFVRRGGTLVLIEPEAGVATQSTVAVLDDMDLHITRRIDADRGGYDSYIFPTDPHHALWEGIPPEHLRMFNGGFGGEAVSQHDIVAPSAPRVLARCGLRLEIPAVMEWRVGEGRVIVSRLQIRGRLEGEPASGGLYDRRKDPVAEHYLLNLLHWAMRPRREIQ
jgi:beta-galactosidase